MSIRASSPLVSERWTGLAALQSLLGQATPHSVMSFEKHDTDQWLGPRSDFQPGTLKLRHCRSPVSRRAPDPHAGPFGRSPVIPAWVVTLPSTSARSCGWRCLDIHQTALADLQLTERIYARSSELRARVISVGSIRHGSTLSGEGITLAERDRGSSLFHCAPEQMSGRGPRSIHRDRRYVGRFGLTEAELIALRTLDTSAS
jgi:hypothetical protein